MRYDECCDWRKYFIITIKIKNIVILHRNSEHRSSRDFGNYSFKMRRPGYIVPSLSGHNGCPRSIFIVQYNFLTRTSAERNLSYGQNIITKCWDSDQHQLELQIANTYPHRFDIYIRKLIFSISNYDEVSDKKKIRNIIVSAELSPCSQRMFALQYHSMNYIHLSWRLNLPTNESLDPNAALIQFHGFYCDMVVAKNKGQQTDGLYVQHIPLLCLVHSIKADQLPNVRQSSKELVAQYQELSRAYQLYYLVPRPLIPEIEDAEENMNFFTDNRKEYSATTTTATTTTTAATTTTDDDHKCHKTYGHNNGGSRAYQQQPMRPFRIPPHSGIRLRHSPITEVLSPTTSFKKQLLFDDTTLINGKA